MIANAITVSRIPFSLCLFFLSPSSVLFAVLYLLCGVTDVLDGFVARKLHTESKIGEMLDSAADLVFAAAYAGRVLPLLCVPVWVWIATAGIAAVKLPGILSESRRKGQLAIPHSFGNKLTGLLIFLLPLTVRLIDIRYTAAAVCTVAAFTAAEEFLCVLCRREKSLCLTSKKNTGNSICQKTSPGS